MKYLKNNKGYTLVELLAVIIILTSIGTIITSIFVSALRGGNKSNTINEVRENGNYVMAQMSKMIIFAESFDGVSQDGINYVNSCTTSLVAPTPTPINYQYIKITSFDGGQTVFSCHDSNGSSTIASNGGTLINIPNLTLTDCTFYCHQNTFSDPPTIDINFSLNKTNSGYFSENQSKVPFQTSVTLRNN